MALFNLKLLIRNLSFVIIHFIPSMNFRILHFYFKRVKGLLVVPILINTYYDELQIQL